MNKDLRTATKDDFKVGTTLIMSEGWEYTITNDVWSAGTQILVDFKGRINLDLDELDSVVFHCADRECYGTRKDSTVCNIKTLRKQDKEYNKNFAEKIKNKELLTDKQLRDFLKGRDIVVYKEQFKNWKL